MNKSDIGKVFVIKHYSGTRSENLMISTGILFEETDHDIVLVHNFSGTGRKPIDITKIPLKNIVKSEEVTPKELNSVDDLI